ncbi:unnamed protein product [Trypanosoma congolense IL3000]|uniref:WGS project CAEQ00000000 data, annotated contig 469 n=1 Tax=Trypanosoma congolense (strain IL3000) TaxID=1068625 RepID=F9WG63_TRYCI|nr:unnamed protein product [Trypanosoma congolense IL3000]
MSTKLSSLKSFPLKQSFNSSFVAGLVSPRQCVLLSLPLAFANTVINSSRRPAELAAKAALYASLSNFSTSYPALSISFRTCRNRRPVILHVSEPIPLDLDWMNLDCHSSNFISRWVIFAAPFSTCCVAQGVTSFNFLLKVHMAASNIVGIALCPLPKVSSASSINKAISHHHLVRNSITITFSLYLICLPLLKFLF